MKDYRSLPQSLTALGLRQIELGLDIYDGDKNMADSNTP